MCSAAVAARLSSALDPLIQERQATPSVPVTCRGRGKRCRHPMAWRGVAWDWMLHGASGPVWSSVVQCGPAQHAAGPLPLLEACHFRRLAFTLGNGFGAGVSTAQAPVGGRARQVMVIVVRYAQRVRYLSFQGQSRARCLRRHFDLKIMPAYRSAF